VSPVFGRTHRRSATGFATKAYVFGGSESGFTGPDNVPATSMSVDHYKFATPGTLGAAASGLSAARCNSAAAGNYFSAVLFGGKSASGPTQIVEKWTFATDLKTAPPTFLHAVREYGSAAGNDRVAFVFGGRSTGPQVISASVDAYLFAAGVYDSAIPQTLTGGSGDDPRYATSAASNSFRALVFGGNNGSTFSLDTVEHRWFASGFAGNFSPHILNVNRQSSSAASNQTIALVFGSYNNGNGNLTGNVETYFFELGGSTKGAQAAFLTPQRAFTSAAAGDTHAMVFGGIDTTGRVSAVDNYSFATLGTCGQTAATILANPRSHTSAASNRLV
jgi:hypothetical protein